MFGITNSIKTGEYELLDSRTVQILNDEKTIISLGAVSIEFSFENKEGSSAEITGDFSENNVAKFRLVNITRPAYGTTDFIKFGQAGNGKDAFISFRVNSLDDKKVRSLEYSIYAK
jgi:hypothetical protein